MGTDSWKRQIKIVEIGYDQKLVPIKVEFLNLRFSIINIQENPPILRKHTIKCWEVEEWPLGLILGWAV